MKKLLVLVAVLALVAVMVMPMAVSAAGTEIDANAVGPSVTLNVPVTFSLGELAVGRNPASGPDWSAAGSVVFSQHSDAASTCVLSATSVNGGPGYQFLNGRMYSADTSKYLNDPMYVTFDAMTYTQLPVGVSMQILPGTTGFNLGAVQFIQTGENPGVGTYYIFVTLTAAVTP